MHVGVVDDRDVARVRVDVDLEGVLQVVLHGSLQDIHRLVLPPLLELHDKGIPIKERPRTVTARDSTSLLLSPLLSDGLLDPAVVWGKRPWHGTQ